MLVDSEFYLSLGDVIPVKFIHLLKILCGTMTFLTFMEFHEKPMQTETPMKCVTDTRMVRTASL